MLNIVQKNLNSLKNNAAYAINMRSFIAYTVLFSVYPVTGHTGLWHRSVFPVYDMLELNISFDKAKMAADFKHGSKQGNILYFDDIQDDRITSYYYPLEIEMQIINNIKSGNIDKSIELFNKLIEGNSENK